MSASDRDQDEILDVEEAARLLRMSADWVYKESAAGRLPYSKFGRKKRFIRSELLAWAKAQREKGAH